MNTKYKTVDIYEITPEILPNQKIEKRADKTLQTFYGLGKQESWEGCQAIMKC